MQLCKTPELKPRNAKQPAKCEKLCRMRAAEEKVCEMFEATGRLKGCERVDEERERQK